MEKNDEISRLRAALQRIADWPYDIMGDCVAQARREAREALQATEAEKLDDVCRIAEEVGL